MKPFLLAFASIFVALDIVGVIPMYLAMTHRMSLQQRKEIANQSMWAALTVAILFIFLGETVFHWLGVSMADFRIAGGVILLLVSLADLLGGPDALFRPSGSTGLVPLAVPLITGPGVLTTAILFVPSAGYFVTLSALVLNYAIAWMILRKCEHITLWIGKDGTVIFSKIAALLLAAIAVAMVRHGVYDAIRDFSHIP